jgi:hypothetical protein
LEARYTVFTGQGDQMKSEYKYRKRWSAIANELGMLDKAHHVAATDSITKADYMVLVNNHRRFVKGMCDLPLAEQEAKLLVFAEKMAELKADQASTKASAEKDMVGLVTKPEETK